LCQFSESVFIVTACHPFDLTRNFTQCSPASTNFKSPYKPFLLLSILDLIGYGSITKNFIEPSFELTETFEEPVDTPSILDTINIIS
jgi:hypothetical protein